MTTLPPAETQTPLTILETIKSKLGLELDYNVFDQDIISFINGAFATLHQLGIGPDEGFEIDGADETWDQYILGDLNLNPVRNYIYLRVRTLFDPPTTSFALDAIKEQIKELEWRLNVYIEGRNNGA